MKTPPRIVEIESDPEVTPSTPKAMTTPPRIVEIESDPEITPSTSKAMDFSFESPEIAVNYDRCNTCKQILDESLPTFSHNEFSETHGKGMISIFC